MGGNTVETGDIFGDGGELYVLTVEAVEGLSFPRLDALDCRNALWIIGLTLEGPPDVPKDVEFKPT